MTIYSRVFTTPASTTKNYEMYVEGDVITYVRLRFPPGPQGLLKVAIFYGEKQIFPWEEGTRFVGDDETIAWDEYFILPESPCRLIIRCENEDDTYEHSVYVTIATQKFAHTKENRLAKLLARALVRVLGYV